MPSKPLIRVYPIEKQKTKVFNGKRYQKHWIWSQKISAQNTAKLLKKKGYLTRITVAIMPHATDPKGRWYVVWKRKR